VSALTDTVRVAVPDDLPALAALEAETFGRDAWSDDTLAITLGAAGRRVVVAVEPDGTVVGYAVSREAGDVLDLERIVVRRSVRRRGTAGVLLADLLTHPGRARAMLLEVSADNAAALAFYAAHGFSRIDVRRRYYRDGSDALVLSRPLVVDGGGDR
jgi:[ribosomal protein S18]-alanine N-acetyltransferase